MSSNNKAEVHRVAEVVSKDHRAQDGMGDRSEFEDLCSKAGRQACEQGQYRESIRLLHLGYLAVKICLGGWVKDG